MFTRVIVRGVAIGLIICFASVGSELLADGRFSNAQHLIPKGDKKAAEVGGVLVSDSQSKVLRFESGAEGSFAIPYSSIKSLQYERASKPRYAAGMLLAWPLLFTKAKKHFLTIQYSDPSGQGKFEMVRLDKDNVQVVLQTVEADTGMKIERTEER